jgi:hypothetical protein
VTRGVHQRHLAQRQRERREVVRRGIRDQHRRLPIPRSASSSAPAATNPRTTAGHVANSER